MSSVFFCMDKYYEYEYDSIFLISSFKLKFKLLDPVYPFSRPGHMCQINDQTKKSDKQIVDSFAGFYLL